MIEDDKNVVVGVIRIFKSLYKNLICKIILINKKEVAK